ncbi:hypothetical protein [Micromonospora sp. NBC_00860]|uniref:hypothetical protein n=1 Tax=Micromonospora sp. NBC_00860 TaxID=2975980 RepID=UPI003867B6B3|nr:hypothetical protein OH804_07415 [Micromonospora sp. NBC_00860]
MALGAVALGAALGADPAHADTPSPSRLPLMEVTASPKAITGSVADVVEAQPIVPLPLPTAVVPLPLPLPSTDPLPLPSAVPLPTPSAAPSTAPPRRPARTPSSSPRATPAPSASGARVASRPSPAPSTRVPATTPRDAGHSTFDGRTSKRARATMTSATGQRPNPPARPAPGPPAVVLALASAPTGAGTGGADPPTSTADAPPPTSPLRPGLTVTSVDRRATSRPVERGPPPPRQLLITHPRPRR